MAQPMHAVTIPRSIARLQSLIATFMLLGVMICLGTVFFAGISTKYKAMRKSMRPAMSVAKQWVGDLSDVFVVFPWKGARFLLWLIFVVPLRALRGAGLAARAARKARLQQHLLMAETDAQGGRQKNKSSPQRGSGADRGAGVAIGSREKGAARRRAAAAALAEHSRKREPEQASRQIARSEGGGGGSALAATSEAQAQRPSQQPPPQSPSPQSVQSHTSPPPQSSLPQSPQPQSAAPMAASQPPLAQSPPPPRSPARAPQCSPARA